MLFFLSGKDFSNKNSKYNTEGITCLGFIETTEVDEWLSGTLTEAANMAISKNTKSQYSTAMKHIERCAIYTNTVMNLPFTLTMTLNYVGFLLDIRKVSSNTVG